jgi:hypothetical protein
VFRLIEHPAPQAISMFLTRSEIQQLTGYKTPATQTRWLQDNGFLFKIGADGYPRLLLTEVEFHMSHSGSDKKITISAEEPNFKVLYGKAEKKKKRTSSEGLLP